MHNVIAFYDDRVLAHEPNIDADFLPQRIDKRIRHLLAGLPVPWKYPEHPGRLKAIQQLLEKSPIEGLHIEGGKAATHEQLARVHTTSYLSDIFSLRGKNAWLDVDTTAVSPGSVDGCRHCYCGGRGGDGKAHEKRLCLGAPAGAPRGARSRPRLLLI